ncbi:MAG: RodZ domain-containing protein [Acidithiobacillus sp.]
MDPIEEDLSHSDLRRAREARGWTLAQVAEQLHITEIQIQGLEQGDYSMLPGATFARGFLKNYARLLHLDPEPFLKNYDASNAGSGLHPTKQVLPDGEGPLHDYSQRMLVTSVLIVIVVIVAVWWIWSRSENSSDLSTATGSAQIEMTQSNAQPSMSATTVKPLLTPIQPAVVTPTQSQAIVAHTSSSLPAVATPDAIHSAGLAFQFRANCWVQVKDAAGKTLLAVLGRPGDQLNVDSGTPPYQILVGDAQGVTISYQGKKVALPANALGVARLQVGTAPAVSGLPVVVGVTQSAVTLRHPVVITSHSLPAKAVLPAVSVNTSSAAVSETASVLSEASHAP